MDKFVIRGGNPLVGTISKGWGAKNSALACMAAPILTEEEVILENIPQVRDIETERRLLAAMGAEVELGYGRAQHRTTISCRGLSNPVAEYDIVRTMRAAARWCWARWWGSRRHGAGLDAGGVRHWRAAYRSAHQGPGEDGDEDYTGARRS